MTPDELNTYAKVMQEMRIRRFSGEQEGESFCIDMDATAFDRTLRRPSHLAPPENWHCAKCGTEWTASGDRICPVCGTKNWPPVSEPLPPEREPSHDEIAFASSIPVTDAERGGREP